MAGPGGVEVGRVGVRATPLTESFGPDLLAYLEKVERTLRVQIPVELDPRRVEADAERIRQETEKTPAQIPVKADTDQFTKRIRADVAELTRSIEVDLPVSADGESLRRDLAEKVKAVEALLKVTVPVDLGDAAKFRREVLDRVAEVQAIADSLHPTIAVGVDAGKAEAVIDVTARDRKSTIEVNVDKSALSRVTSALSGISRLIGSTSVPIIRPAALVAGLAALTQSSLGLAASLAPAVGSLALLPSIGAAAGVAVGTLAVGFRGIGDALTAGADPKKADQFAAAMAKLSPAARDLVTSIRGLGPAFTALRLDVQQHLLAGVGDEVTRLGSTYLPVLRSGLSSVAGQFNELAKATSKQLLNPSSVADTRSLIGSLSQSLAALRPIGADLARILLTLSAAGGTFLPNLSKGLADATGRFARFVDAARQSGQLQQFIGAGLGVLRQIGQVAGSAASAIAGIASAAQKAGGGGLATLAKVFAAIDAFVHSAAGQGALSTVFSGAASGLTQFSKAFGPIGKALAALAPLIGNLARQFGSVLGAALTALAPVLATLGPPLAILVTQIGDALVIGLQKAAPYLLALAQALAANRPLLIAVGLALLAIVSPVAGVVAAIAAVVIVFQRFGSQITSALAPVIAGVTSFGQSLSTAFAVVLPALQGLAAKLLPILMQLGQQIIAVVGPALTSIGTIISTQVAPALAAFITAVTPVVAFLVRVFGGVLIDALKGAVQVIKGTLAVIAGVFNLFADLLSGRWGKLWGDVKQIISGALSAIVGAVRVYLAVGVLRLTKVAIDGVRALFSGGFSFIRSLVFTAMASIRGYASAGMAGLRSAISSGVSQAVSLVRGLPGRIVSAIGNLGSLLYSAGANLIKGLANGMLSQLRAVLGAASSIAQRIRNLFPGSPIKEGPLIGWNNGGAGKRLVSLLAEGLSDTSSVDTAVASLAARIQIPGPRTPSFGQTTGARGASATYNFGGVTTQSVEQFVRLLDERQRRADALAGVG